MILSERTVAEGVVVCERCQQHPASGALSTITVTDTGVRRETVEHICANCFAARQVECMRHAAEVRADTERSAHDGTLFEELREEVAMLGADPSPQELAQAATFLDQAASVLPVPLPPDLQAFADKHRFPAA